MSGVSSDTIEKPDPMLLLAAAKELSGRYGLGGYDLESTLKALWKIRSQVDLAMSILGVSLDQRKALEAQWDITRTDQKSPRYLKDPHLETLEKIVEGVLIYIKSIRPKDEPGAYHFDFEFHCKACGGYMLKAPDDGDGAAPASCSACGNVYGTFHDFQELCRWKARHELHRLGLE